MSPPSPPPLGRKTSLIDLKDWVVDDGPLMNGRTPTQQAFSAPLISFQVQQPALTKPKPKPKPANLSTTKVPNSKSSPFLYPPQSPPRPGHGPSSSISSMHSVSLSSDTDPSTPGSVAEFIATFPVDSDSTSLSESYEEVSAPSLSPAERTLDWQYALANRKPPPPPKRRSSNASLSVRAPPSPSSPIIRPAISASSSTSTLGTPPPYPAYTPRRSAPPPPPSRSSDRSSILSTTSYSSRSSHSHSRHTTLASVSSAGAGAALALKTKRPTPVPLAARKRYEAVFVRNVLQRRKAVKQKEMEKPSFLSPAEARGRRAAGWRGLSVDLIAGPDGVPLDRDAQKKAEEKEEDEGAVGKDEKLEGPIIKLVWKRSGLESSRLAEIWTECDPTAQGTLSLDAFVKGMWRIDEELRRTAQRSTTSFSRSSSLRHASSNQPPPRLPPRSRDILR